MYIYIYVCTMINMDINGYQWISMDINIWTILFAAGYGLEPPRAHGTEQRGARRGGPVVRFPMKPLGFLHRTTGSGGRYGDFLLEIHGLPSGKHTKNDGKSPFSMGKSTISMASFNSKLLNYQRVWEFLYRIINDCNYNDHVGTWAPLQLWIMVYNIL